MLIDCPAVRVRPPSPPVVRRSAGARVGDIRAASLGVPAIPEPRASPSPRNARTAPKARTATPSESSARPIRRLPDGQCLCSRVALPLSRRTTLSERVADETPTSCVMTASGVMIGRRPRRATRNARSPSSPYMKKRSSNPPSTSHTSRGASRRQPVTMSTSRTVSRCQPPSDSGSNTRDPLNTVDRSVEKQKRLHSDGLPQHEPGHTVPSGHSVRPP